MGGKFILSLKTIVNEYDFGYGIERNFSRRFLLLMLSYMVVKFGATTYLENIEIGLRKSINVLEPITFKLKSLHPILST